MKIFEQRFPHDRKPFRIIETTPTMDGPRDRITNATFTTLGEAEDFVKRHVAHTTPKDRLNLYLQRAHLEATTNRGQAVHNNSTRERFLYEGKLQAIEEMLKEVNNGEAQ